MCVINDKNVVAIGAAFLFNHTQQRRQKFLILPSPILSGGVYMLNNVFFLLILIRFLLEFF